MPIAGDQRHRLEAGMNQNSQPGTALIQNDRLLNLPREVADVLSSPGRHELHAARGAVHSLWLGEALDRSARSSGGARGPRGARRASEADVPAGTGFANGA